jgi:hypothetical protein
MNPQCVAFTELHNFKFNALPVNTTINQAGTYVITALFNDSMTHNHAETVQKIFVISPNNTSNQDTGIIHGVANVTNSNCTVNYTIEGGKVLGIVYDIQSKTVIVSVKNTDNGTLTVTLPRALIDARLPNGNDDKYYVLIDSMEARYNETEATETNRILLIPFAQGASAIEIIGTYIP